MQFTSQVREYLAKVDPEFRRLYEKHQQYEKELSGLASKGFLSQEEELTVAEKKKLKLNLKDKMVAIAKKYEKQLQSIKS